MKCSVCRKFKPWLIKVRGSLLCEACKRDSELQLERNDGIVNHPAGTQNIKNEPEAVAEKQDQASTLDFSNGDSEQCDTDSEENTSPDESSHPKHNDEDLRNQEIQIKDELTVEESKVQNIVDEHTEGETRSCKLCNFTSTSRHLLLMHQRANHPVERLIDCTICRKRLQGQALYQQHLQEKHDGFGGECKICLEKFRESGAVKSHKRRCLGRLLFICNSCEKRYASKESVLKHAKDQCCLANTEDAAFIEKRFKQQFFTCALCDDGRAFEKDPYWSHIEEVHNGNVIRCKYCPKTFSLKISCSRHMRYNCIASDRIVRQDVKCPNCPKIFDTQRKLEGHVERAHYPVSCKVCQIQFKNLSALKRHREKEHKKTNRECLYCPKKFYIDSHYHSHIKTHRK